jgi:hypothetical protein
VASGIFRQSIQRVAVDRDFVDRLVDTALGRSESAAA